VPIQEDIQPMSPTVNSDRQRVAHKHIEEAGVMEVFIQSAGWLLLKDYILDRINSAKNKVFNKAFPPEELEAQKREVYILKKVLERPDRMIELGAEAEETLKNLK
jgi:hypothetical protein